MKKALPLLITLLCCCEKSNDFSPSELSNLMELTIENNNMPADGVSNIKVIASFPENFDNAQDDKVRFKVFKDSIITINNDIVFTSINGSDKKVSDILINNKKADTIEVEAAVTINKSQISKRINAVFKNAYPDRLRIIADSLTIAPNSFKELQITTTLFREIGNVNQGIKVETKVIDSDGIPRGIFNGYKEILDNDSSLILNRYTLGNDSYVGELYIVSLTENPMNQMISDTLMIFSKN